MSTCLGSFSPPPFFFFCPPPPRVSPGSPPRRRRRRLAVHLRRPRRADPAPSAKRNSATLGLVSTLDVQIQGPSSLGLSSASGAAGRPRGQLVHQTAQTPLTANICRGRRRTRRRSGSGSRRCWAPGRSTTSTSIVPEAPSQDRARRGPDRIHQRGVRVRAAGLQEREQLQPVAALVEVEVGDEDGGLVARGLDEDAAVGVGDERGAVEGERRLVADAVDGDHEDAVGDPVGDDHLLPQRLGVEVGVVGLGADRGRVDEHVGAARGCRRGRPRGTTGPSRSGSPSRRVAERDDREGVVVGRARAEVACPRSSRR